MAGFVFLKPLKRNPNHCYVSQRILAFYSFSLNTINISQRENSGILKKVVAFICE